jgi:hypothetical protein
MALAFMALLTSGCGDDEDVPDADDLPLAPGLAVANSDVRLSMVDDSPYRQLVLTGSTAMTSRAINRVEVAYLREQGWEIRRHKDGTTNAYGSEDGPWAFIGHADGDCRGLAESSGTDYICASLG